MLLKKNNTDHHHHLWQPSTLALNTPFPLAPPFFLRPLPSSLKISPSLSHSRMPQKVFFLFFSLTTKRGLHCVHLFFLAQRGHQGIYRPLIFFYFKNKIFFSKRLLHVENSKSLVACAFSLGVLLRYHPFDFLGESVYLPAVEDWSNLRMRDHVAIVLFNSKPAAFLSLE